MKRVHSLALALALSAIGTPAWAAADDKHDAHHPAGTAGPVSKATPGKSGPDMTRMDTQMKAMQEMHDKMMAAKTPEERNALMAAHLKTMQDSMAMMNATFPSGMGGMMGDKMGGMKEDMKGGLKGGMAARHQMMEKRMDMMQAMMQMMSDRLPAAPVK